MGEKLRKQVARWARPAILGTVIGSAGMNALAFAAHTTTVWMTSAAITLGAAGFRGHRDRRRYGRWPTGAT